MCAAAPHGAARLPPDKCLHSAFRRGRSRSKAFRRANARPDLTRSRVGAAVGCDLLILLLKIKRSQPRCTRQLLQVSRWAHACGSWLAREGGLTADQSLPDLPPPPVGASLLAMVVNDNAGSLTPRGVLSSIASRLAPTRAQRNQAGRSAASLLILTCPVGRPSGGVHPGGRRAAPCGEAAHIERRCSEANRRRCPRMNTGARECRA